MARPCITDEQCIMCERVFVVLGPYPPRKDSSGEPCDTVSVSPLPQPFECAHPDGADRLPEWIWRSSLCLVRGELTQPHSYLLLPANYIHKLCLKIISLV